VVVNFSDQVEAHKKAGTIVSFLKQHGIEVMERGPVAAADDDKAKVPNTAAGVGGKVVLLDTNKDHIAPAAANKGGSGNESEESGKKVKKKRKKSHKDQKKQKKKKKKHD